VWNNVTTVLRLPSTFSGKVISVTSIILIIRKTLYLTMGGIEGLSE
jgi:hypothetical protein